jgi:hypothetical protein
MGVRDGGSSTLIDAVAYSRDTTLSQPLSWSRPPLRSDLKDPGLRKQGEKKIMTF